MLLPIAWQDRRQDYMIQFLCLYKLIQDYDIIYNLICLNSDPPSKILLSNWSTDVPVTSKQ